MRVGIIGRHASILGTAVGQAEALGHVTLGTVDDAVALRWIEDGAIEALVIGGGVEPESRQRLLDACRQAQVTAHEVFGPNHLEQALRKL
jgi:hypothetical protein